MPIYRISLSLGCESVFEFPQSHVHSGHTILTPRVIDYSFDRRDKKNNGFDLGDFRFGDLKSNHERKVGWVRSSEGRLRGHQDGTQWSG